MRYLIFIVLISFPALSFTILSGPNEATLNSTRAEPKVQFVWNGSAPEIDEKSEFEGGRYQDLQDDAFMAKLLDIAFAKWNDVETSFLVMEVERNEQIDSDSEDLVHSIVVKDSVNLSAAAFAVPTLSEDASIIEDCDVTISNNKTTAKSLAYTLVHEIGHCLGLGHNHTNYNAIMGYSRSSRSINLGADDIAGITYLYPLEDSYRDNSKEFLACAVVGKDVETAGLLLLLPLLAVSIVRLKSMV